MSTVNPYISLIAMTEFLENVEEIVPQYIMRGNLCIKIINLLYVEPTLCRAYNVEPTLCRAYVEPTLCRAYTMSSLC